METNTNTAPAIETSTVTLGKTTYTVVGPLACSLFLMGPRGGQSHLQQNAKNQDTWAHIKMAGYRGQTTWYQRLADGSFKAVR